MYVCITEDLGPPLLSVSDRLSPVGDAPQVPVIEVTPTKGCASCHPACTSIAVFRDGWSAFSSHGQTIEGISALSLPWRHPCSLQDASVPNLVPQGDPQDVTKAMLLKRLQLTTVMLGHSPCLCSIEEHRQHQGPEDAYFSGNTLVQFACLL